MSKHSSDGTDKKEGNANVVSIYGIGYFVSTFMDNDLSEIQGHKINVTEIIKTKEFITKWRTYHLLLSAVNHELPIEMDSALVEKIAKRIESEHIQKMPKEIFNSTKLKEKKPSVNSRVKMIESHDEWKNI